MGIGCKDENSVAMIILASHGVPSTGHCIKGLQTPSEKRACNKKHPAKFFSVVFLEHVLQAILAHTHAN